jgi:hypothetical protein
VGTTGTDAVLLAVVVGALAVVWLAVHLGRALVPARPLLPAPDQPPAGLGRLVPVGTQVEQEARRGLVALELWLSAPRRLDAGEAG